MTQNYTPPKRKTKVVFVQLGSPSEPTTKALRTYLRKFLGDPRVVDHIDNNALNNSKSNLRIVSKQVNQQKQNMRKKRNG